MIEVTYETDELVVATCGRFLITLVAGTVTLEYLAEAHSAGRALGERFPGQVASLTLTSPDVQIPEAEVREDASRKTKEANTWVGAGATVVSGVGFKASAARSVLTAITVFSRHPPRKVFGDAPSAVDWLVDTVGGAEARAPLLAWLAGRGFGRTAAVG